MKQKQKIILSIIILLIILAGVSFWYITYNQRNNTINSYDDCAAAGYPILESYPEQCTVPNGKTYTRSINQEEVTSPLSLEGQTVCLPHKNTEGPHTMECAIGLKTNDGKYYGLGTDPYDSAMSTTNRQIRVNGTLKTSSDSKYQSEGTITVTSYEFLD
jgi:hypothetical protein